MLEADSVEVALVALPVATEGLLFTPHSATGFLHGWRAVLRRRAVAIISARSKTEFVCRCDALVDPIRCLVMLMMVKAGMALGENVSLWHLVSACDEHGIGELPNLGRWAFLSQELGCGFE